MYSSLPSASKIYVSSAKSRQKSASSAKRRRKKVEPIPNIQSNSDETLISIAKNKELEYEAASSDILQSNTSASSQCYLEKDDSSSEFSLPTVKNRRQSQASSGKSKRKTIIESPEKNIISKPSTVENNYEISHPGKSDEDDDLIPENYQPVTELANESEKCISLGRKDSLLSPIKSKKNVSKESENSSNEQIQAQILEKSDVTLNESDHETVNNTDNMNSNVSNFHEQSEDKDLENNVAIPQHNSTENLKEDTVENSLCDDIVDVLDNHDITDINANVQDNSSHSSCSHNENINQESSQCLNEDNIPASTDLPLNENISDKRTESQINVSKDSLGMQDESVPKTSTAVWVQSPELSETSCTESLMNESGISQPNIPANLNESKSSVSYSECSTTSEEKIYYREHSDVCQSYSDLGRTRFSSSSLHRFPSWPSSLDYSKNFYRTPTLKVTSFSDKATYTVDLLPAKCDKESSSDDFTCNGNGDRVELKKESKSVSTTFHEVVSQNIMPPLAMLQARSRSYVFGSMGPKGSLLGSDELTRLFPDSQVTVFIGTWNMNSQNPPDNINDFLLPLNINTLPDIYAIGIQEGSQSRSEWEVLLQTTLGPSHVLFTSSSLGVLHLSIFLRRDLIWFCSVPEEASVATRPGSMVKTKGAVAICFMFFGTSFLFVNSHLTAHEQKLKERLSDYEKICSSLDLPKLIPSKSKNCNKDVTSRFDCVFWCGDLNFRVIRDRPSVMSFVNQNIRRPLPSCSFLIKHDQLHKAMADGTAFHGFKEGVINFIPSYKFNVGTSTFAEAKLRVPSYTDRILYRCKEEKSLISCLHYNAVSDILTSDHKPVFAVFKVLLKPGRDNVPLAGGMFKRDVYLEAIKRRARFLEVQRNQGQSTVCTVM